MELTEESRELIRLAAADKGVAENQICMVCLATITTMCFRGTGVCGEQCRKRRDNESTEQRAVNP